MPDSQKTPKTKERSAVLPTPALGALARALKRFANSENAPDARAQANEIEDALKRIN